MARKQQNNPGLLFVDRKKDDLSDHDPDEEMMKRTTAHISQMVMGMHQLNHRIHMMIVMAVMKTVVILMVMALMTTWMMSLQAFMK